MDTTSQQDLEDHARKAVDKTLRLYGLRTQPHFDRTLETERSLWVDCRLATAQADRAFVYAVLDDHGWHPDRARLSRHRDTYDVLRLKHRATGATLVLIIKSPFAELPHLEVA